MMQARHMLLAMGLFGAFSLPWFPHSVRSEAAVLDPRALSLVERFAQTFHGLRGATYRDVKRERLRDGKLTFEEVRIKLQPPTRAYLYTLKPVRGREIIYDGKRDPRTMTVHPGHFPDITLQLDVEGSLATKDQHHTMTEVGFAAELSTMRAELRLAQRDPQGERLTVLGTRDFDGRKVEGVAFFSGTRPARRETAKSGETLLSFARRVGMQAYPIFVANPDLRSLTSKLEPGRSYLVPAYRAARLEYWFDAETGMLLKQSIWNADGKLYESYEHFDMRLNPPLSDADFDPNNPEYGF